MTDLAGFELVDATRDGARKAAGLGLCDECFGRMFGRLGHGLSNPDRAMRLRSALHSVGADVPDIPVADCTLCEGSFGRLDVWAERARDAATGLEWTRFTCGSRWEPETLAREEMFWTDVGTPFGESIRTAFNRELGKRLEALTGFRGGTSDAHLVFLADVPVGQVHVTIMPIFFEGRYRKLDRTLPQTRWPCRRCRGRGCETCGGTGHTYPTSVEELIGAPILRTTAGSGTRFHGMGREDIDARMLGDGRPFVLEIREPRRRTVDVSMALGEIAQEAGGRVEVQDFQPVESTRVVAVKMATPEKSYRVRISGSVEVAKVNEALTIACARTIAQRTPSRVAHRRSDRVRTRRIVSAAVVDAGTDEFTIELRAEAGTYVKEWVEGDGGRTEPCLATLLGSPLKVRELDVIAVHDRPSPG